MYDDREKLVDKAGPSNAVQVFPSLFPSNFLFCDSFQLSSYCNIFMFTSKNLYWNCLSIAFAAKYTLALVNMSHVKLYNEDAPMIFPFLELEYW